MNSKEEAAPDEVLAILVSVINSSEKRVDEGPGVVLTVGGQVISGKVIPNWQWFEDVRNGSRDAFIAAGGDPEADHEGGFALLFREMAKNLVERAKEFAAAKDAVENLAPHFQQMIAEQDTPGFIHLHEARAYAPGSIGLPANGMYWRGRLSEVSGWAFGLVSQQQD